jgi:hypothetical protein
MAIRTIFSMAEDCGRGERRGWQEFVRDYAGIARAQLQQYFPTLLADGDTHLVGIFRRAAAESNVWFAGLQFSNEREFMMSFRELVFAYARQQERIPTPQVSLEQVRELMQDLSLVEREMLWLFIRGYDTQQIAAIMMNAEVTAEAVKQTAGERLATLLPGSDPRAFTISARPLMEAAEAAKSGECVSLKTFNNLVNGQITWREREAAEKHMVACFHCLDRFATFNELVHLRKRVPQTPEPEVQGILAQLDLPRAKARGVFSRLLAR